MRHKLNPQPSRLTIARNIKSLREHRQLSQKELARMSGVSQRTVSNIELERTDDAGLHEIEQAFHDLNARAGIFLLA